MQALVEPVDPAQRTALFAGLTELADEDPLIDLRIDEGDGEAAISLHGEVQKEVVAALLEERYGVRARFSGTSVVCIERVVGTGASVDRIGSGRQPLPGRDRAARRGRTGRARHRVLARHRAGSLPPAFVAATEEGVRPACARACTAGRSPTAWSP